MNKAFVKESDGADDDDEIALPAIPAGSKNYMTPQGHQRIKDELLHLIDEERPEVVRVVSWAASNGDRSENGDYLYGKKRLREIDRRIRFSPSGWTMPRWSILRCITAATRSSSAPPSLTKTSAAKRIPSPSWASMNSIP
jgi:hypothetical protein